MNIKNSNPFGRIPNACMDEPGLFRDVLTFGHSLCAPDGEPYDGMPESLTILALMDDYIEDETYEIVEGDFRERLLHHCTADLREEAYEYLEEPVPIEIEAPIDILRRINKKVAHMLVGSWLVTTKLQATL